MISVEQPNRSERTSPSIRQHSLLSDGWARTLRYLRVSVTDRCNYNCKYCMPADLWAPVDRAKLLTFKEIARVCAILAPHGVEKVRITGGEPLVRKNLVQLIEQLAAIPEIHEIAMTTNGHLLPQFAASLRAAGLRRLTVSLDTFHEDRFAQVTSGGDLTHVLRGLEAATSVGFDDIGINVVGLRDVNQGDLVEIAARCWSNGWRPRFIELMPIGGLAYQSDSRRLTQETMLDELSTSFDLEPTELGRSATSGPARYYRVSSGPFAGELLGTISPMSDAHFCGDCNRARLTAQGGFRACLANDEEVSVLHMLRDGASDDEICNALRVALGDKLEGHRMTDGTFVPLSVMTGIGG